jgi:DNA ligase-associated metallophosphoesterase
MRESVVSDTLTDPVIAIRGEALRLLPERAVYWPAARSLIAADLHWGKEETFRAAAIPIPAGPVRADLDRLDAALSRTGAERLLVLGDLWHARAGMADALLTELAAWRRSRPGLRVELVRGNHDRRAGNAPAGLGIVDRVEPAVEGPFVFQHYPDPSPAGYVLAGHVHPAVVLRGAGRQRVRLPCFWFGAEVALLPAFGGFTGSGDVSPGSGDRVFVIADGEVIEVSESG